jgi:hypothetical protein
MGKIWIASHAQKLFRGFGASRMGVFLSASIESILKLNL